MHKLSRNTVENALHEAVQRTFIGGDSISRQLSYANTLLASQDSFPPHNVESLGDDRYRITLAIAGFSESDVEITQEDNKLVVTGKKPEAPESPPEYLYRGIAARGFTRAFALADHVKVTGASMKNGMLSIELFRDLPPAMKPRNIPIESSDNQAREDSKE